MRFKSSPKTFRTVSLILFSGFLLYCAAMIIVRLSITQMAYQFEELKNYERSLKEEQLRLRATVSKKLSPQAWKLKGFEEPNPKQIVVIP